MTETDETPWSSPTAPARSTSKKAQLQRRVAQLITEAPATGGWTAQGFRPDLDLLSRVLALTDPQDVRVGSVATGLDLWAAATLRQAGLRGVRPHEGEPFYVGDLARGAQSTFHLIDRALQDLAALDAQIRRVAPSQAIALRATSQALTSQLRRLHRAIESSTTAVLGESRRKQVDVFLAEWDRGLELLISTKTFALAVNAKELVKTSRTAGRSSTVT